MKTSKLEFLCKGAKKVRRLCWRVERVNVNVGSQSWCCGGSKEIQPCSRERRGCEGWCWDASEFLNHGSEIGGVCG